MTTQSSTPQSTPPPIMPEHEPDGVYSGGVLLVNSSLLLLVLLTLFFVARVFHWFAADPSLAGARQTWQLQQTSPGVEPNQAYDRERLQAAEQTVLKGYGWQDAEHQHARIPIDRAMQILADENLQLNWPKSQADHESDAISGARTSTPSRGQTRQEKVP